MQQRQFKSIEAAIILVLSDIFCADVKKIRERLLSFRPEETEEALMDMCKNRLIQKDVDGYYHLKPFWWEKLMIIDRTI